jgi:hypothetical protein
MLLEKPVWRTKSGSSFLALNLLAFTDGTSALLFEPSNENHTETVLRARRRESEAQTMADEGQTILPLG